MRYCKKCGEKIGFFESEAEGMHYRCYEKDLKEKEVINLAEEESKCSEAIIQETSMDSVQDESECDELIAQETSMDSSQNEIEENIWWTKCLRTITVIYLILAVIGSIFLGIGIGDVEGFAIACGVIVTSFVSVAIIMVIIEISENTDKARKNSDEMLKILKSDSQ